jgi:hypothetical protein
VTHDIQQSVIIAAVLLEIEAQVEHGMAQHAGVVEHEHDQQPPDPAIAIHEGVDRLELDVGDPRPDQCGQTRVATLYEVLEVADAIGNQRRRWGYERGVTGTCPADPVLASTKLPGFLVRAAAAAEQTGMNLPQESARQGESVS